ncbi:ATP-dependent DNA helicase PIF1-like protein [Tanacetum coccineum]
MSYPRAEYTMDVYNRLVYDELAYDNDKLREQHKRLYSILTDEQKSIYETIMDSVDKKEGRMFFVYGYGRTSKTYLYKTMSAACRSQGGIVLNVASSGIAALLLKDDEAPMVNRQCYEAFDWTMRDICRMDPSVPSEQHCKLMKLTVNMRLGSGVDSSEKKEIQDFADWILNIGNGNIGRKNDGEAKVEFLDDMLIPEYNDHIGSIIQETYLDLLRNLYDSDYLQDRVVLAPTHELVDMISDKMLSLLPMDLKTYNSSDMVGVVDVDTSFDEFIYTEEFLNNINMSRILHHSLQLKIGMSVMCMRNINQKAGLCNGTRLRVLRMGTNVIEAKIISGGSVGTIYVIPRMVITPSENKLPFKLNRRLFPIQIYLGLTINKIQGQKLSKVGLFLQRPVFSHGQLYVDVSRVKSRKGLKILCCDDDGKYTNSTTNVVYKEVLFRI